MFVFLLKKDKRLSERGEKRKKKREEMLKRYMRTGGEDSWIQVQVYGKSSEGSCNKNLYNIIKKA